MHPFVHRYELDTTRPTAKEVLRDVGVLTVLPGAVLGVGILAAGSARRLRGAEEPAGRLHAPTEPVAPSEIETLAVGEALFLARLGEG